MKALGILGIGAGVLVLAVAGPFLIRGAFAKGGGGEKGKGGGSGGGGQESAPPPPAAGATPPPATSQPSNVGDQIGSVINAVSSGVVQVGGFFAGLAKGGSGAGAGS